MSKLFKRMHGIYLPSFRLFLPFTESRRETQPRDNLIQTIVAILGIFGNFLASYILCTRKEMRNAFNLLLVTMACFDSLYLFGSILESFRKPDVFNMATGTHTVLFPYLLYPFTQFAFTASIFMTIAIALER